VDRHPLRADRCGGSTLLGIVATRRYPIGGHDIADRSPSLHWPAPLGASEVQQDRGPVMVTVEYQIDPAQVQTFTALMQRMRRLRRRDGAFMWELFHDIEHPGRMVECFMVESWLEHLRQHQRVTIADHEAIEQTRAYHRGSEPPKVRHLVADRPR
jgi:hypothetical protein